MAADDPIWQPPDDFAGGGDAVQERMRVNQLRALLGKAPLPAAPPTSAPSAISSRLLGRTAPPTPTFHATQAPTAPPPGWDQQRSVFDELGEGPSPSWKPMTPAGGALYGLGLAALAGPEGMTPQNVIPAVGQSLQAFAPRNRDVQEDVMYPAFQRSHTAPSTRPNYYDLTAPSAHYSSTLEQADKGLRTSQRSSMPARGGRRTRSPGMCL